MGILIVHETRFAPLINVHTSSTAIHLDPDSVIAIHIGIMRGDQYFWYLYENCVANQLLC